MTITSSWPNHVDVFDQTPYQDHVEYIYAAFANAWIGSILALEKGIGTGTGHDSPLYSTAYQQSFINLKSRINNIETNLVAQPKIDSAVGDIKPVAAAAAVGSTGKTADASHVHLGVRTFNGRSGVVSPGTGDYSADMVTNAADLSAVANVFQGRLEAESFASDGLSTSTGLGSRYVGGTNGGPPTESNPAHIVTSGFNRGDISADRTGAVWVCDVAGAPGEWIARPRLAPSVRIHPTSDLAIVAGAPKTRVTTMSTNDSFGAVNQGAAITFAGGANSLLVHQSGVYFVSWRVAYRNGSGNLPDYGEYIATLNFNGDTGDDVRQGDAQGGGANGSTPTPGGADMVYVPAGTFVNLYAKQFNQANSTQYVWGDGAQTWLSLSLWDATVVPVS